MLADNIQILFEFVQGFACMKALMHLCRRPEALMQEVIKYQQQVQILPLPTLGISYSLHLPGRQQFICQQLMRTARKPKSIPKGSSRCYNLLQSTYSV
jgi:hypothetical protein